MNKRKISFNFIDLIILAVLAAAVGVLFYVFLYGIPKSNQQTEKTVIEYTVEILNLDEKTAQSVDLLLNDKSEKHMAYNGVDQKICMGEVQSSQYGDFSMLVFDYGDEREEASPVEGQVFLDITIRAEAVETESAYMVGNYAIRVGEQYSLILPNFYGYGYCISLNTDPDGKKGTAASEAVGTSEEGSEAEDPDGTGKNPGMIPAWFP